VAVRAAAQLPAIAGGSPVRRVMLPYGHQVVGTEEDRAVLQVLRSERLTQGPVCRRFEKKLRAVCGARRLVAFNSGTTALQAALAVLGIGTGDEVVVPAITFVATANAVLYQGARPVVADVESDTLCLDPASLERAISPATRAVVVMHYAGHPASLEAVLEVARRHRLAVVEDAAHALGARWTRAGQVVPVGSLADSLCAFSFHPVKAITTAEGGAVACSSELLAARLRAFRHHGIADGPDRAADGDRIAMLGINGRMSELHAALGEVQLDKLPLLLQRRRQLAARYRQELADRRELELPEERPGCSSAWHLFAIRLRSGYWRADRNTILQALRAEGIGVQVHYVPLYLHPHLRRRAGLVAGGCPVAENSWPRLLSLPLWPGMTAADQDDVLEALERVSNFFRR